MLHVEDCLGYVYLWYDRQRNMYYLGSHFYGIYSYLCGSAWMRKAYNKRPTDFRRHILYRLQEGTKQDLQAVEQRYLDLIKPHELGTRYYNLKRQATGGNGGARKGQKNTPESNILRSIAGKGKKKPPGHGEKLRAIALTRYKVVLPNGRWTWGRRQQPTTPAPSQTC